MALQKGGEGIMADEAVVSALNHLIETCRDGEMGFWSAAEHIQDAGLKWMFQGVARTRGEFADELKQEVRRLGGAVEEGGSLAGSMHRRWMDVKSAVKARDDASILAETERGEHIAVKAYEHALQASLPPPAQALVARQHAAVTETHARVAALAEEWRQRARPAG